MLVTTQCASYCRYCTRSRIVGDPTQNFNRRDHEAQLDYLRRTPQVRDVLISGGDGLTLAPKLFEKILRGLREIPHIEIIRIGTRVPVFLPQRIDDELCEMLQKYHPLWINLHFNHPNEITPGGLARGRQADAGRHPGRQPERPARGRQRLRPHPARARPQARREPDPAVLPVPVRPRRRLRALPDAGRQGPRDHGGPARPHVRLRGADVRHRRARRRRQDPGHAELPDLATATTRSCCATTRATSRPTRSPRRTSGTTRRRARTASTSARSPGQSGVLGLLEGERHVDRAQGLRRGPHPRQHRGPSAARTRRSGCRSASAPSRAGPRRAARPRGRAPSQATRPEYGPGEEPRPREGEPTASAHGELL